MCHAHLFAVWDANTLPVKFRSFQNLFTRLFDVLFCSHIFFHIASRITMLVLSVSLTAFCDLCVNYAALMTFCCFTPETCFGHRKTPSQTVTCSLTIRETDFM